MNLSLSKSAQIDVWLFAHPYRWIIFGNDKEVLKRIRALADSDIMLAESTADGFNLQQFYKIDEESDEIYFETYGTWNSTSGIVDERSTKIISRRRENLRGKTITSSFVVLKNDSRNHLTDFADKNIDSMTKMNYLIVNSILDKLNVTRKELFQGTWGYYDKPTKQWSGVMGDLVYHRADIGGENKSKTFRIKFLSFRIAVFIDRGSLSVH